MYRGGILTEQFVRSGALSVWKFARICSSKVYIWGMNIHLSSVMSKHFGIDGSSFGYAFSFIFCFLSIVGILYFNYKQFT